MPQRLATTKTREISGKNHKVWRFQALRKCQKNAVEELGSVVGPVIQANVRLSFDYDLSSGGLLYCVSQ